MSSPRDSSTGDGAPPAEGSPTESQSEQRGEQRRTINKEFDSLESFISEYVANISRSGVFISSRAPLPIGTVVNLEFTVLMDGVHTIVGTGEVVRVVDDPPGMGVVFTELSSASEVIIARLLTAPSSASAERGRGGDDG